PNVTEVATVPPPVAGPPGPLGGGDGPAAGAVERVPGRRRGTSAPAPGRRAPAAGGGAARGHPPAVRAGVRVRARPARLRGPARWLAGGAVLAVVAVLAAAVAHRYASAPARRPRGAGGEPVRLAPAEDRKPADGSPVALGVMLFKPMGDPGERGWMRDALRDGLNTQLSGLSNVKVYSKEFIDFLITRQNLTEIEAASRLGIKKMLSGSFGVVGEQLRIETHVVDVATGVLETSYSTTGRAEDFLALQNKMVMGVIARMNLPVTPEEQKALVARQNTDVEALKLLLEAEGGARPSPPPGPGSGLLRWMARLGPAAALADDQPAKTEILVVLERYRQATEMRELSALGALYAEFPP